MQLMQNVTRAVVDYQRNVQAYSIARRDGQGTIIAGSN
jgi:hypothetical protein